MASNVILGIWNSQQFQRIKLENVNLENKVEVLKSQLSKTLGDNSPKNLELAFCGVILEDDNSLSSYGVTSGVTIHVVEKKIKENVSDDKKISEAEVQELVSNFRSFKLSPTFRGTLHRLENPDEVDKVISAVPGLENDPVAIAIISKPDLILHLGDPKTVRKIAEQHPKLIEAAKYIGTDFHKETSSNLATASNQPSTSSGYSYSLEALSDDDDDMDSNSDTNMSQHPLSRNSSYNAITAAQLAAAIANATNTTFNTNSAGMPSSTQSPSIITNEMFSSAMQHAFAFGGSNNGSFSPVTPSREDEESLESITRRLQPQLQQMREMGLVNDSINVRALQATSGDVQAAIELVFNGVID